MPLNRDQMREYQRKRRSENKSPVKLEDQPQANEVPLNREVPPPLDSPHTKTDQLFENKKPGYWIFEKEMIEKKCWYCGEPFQTRLLLNKFCCPDHKERWLIASLRMGK